MSQFTRALANILSVAVLALASPASVFGCTAPEAGPPNSTLQGKAELPEHSTELLTGMQAVRWLGGFGARVLCELDRLEAGGSQVCGEVETEQLSDGQAAAATSAFLTLLFAAHGHMDVAEDGAFLPLAPPDTLPPDAHGKFTFVPADPLAVIDAVGKLTWIEIGWSANEDALDPEVAAAVEPMPDVRDVTSATFDEAAETGPALEWISLTVELEDATLTIETGLWRPDGSRLAPDAVASPDDLRVIHVAAAKRTYNMATNLGSRLFKNKPGIANNTVAREKRFKYLKNLRHVRHNATTQKERNRAKGLLSEYRKERQSGSGRAAFNMLKNRNEYNGIVKRHLDTIRNPRSTNP